MEQITLNVGGVKFETYRSTLTAYPKTLLGQMFQHMIITPTDNEYFFDRDGHIFRYIMQFYRTGKVFWPDENMKDSMCAPFISHEELQIEYDYFVIPTGKPWKQPSTTQQRMATLIDSFIDAFIGAFYEAIAHYDLVVCLWFLYGEDVEIDQQALWADKMTELFRPFKHTAYLILKEYGNEIGEYLQQHIQELNWNMALEANHSDEKPRFLVTLQVKQDLFRDAVIKYSKLSELNKRTRM